MVGHSTQANTADYGTKAPRKKNFLSLRGYSLVNQILLISGGEFLFMVDPPYPTPQDTE